MGFVLVQTLSEDLQKQFNPFSKFSVRIPREGFVKLVQSLHFLRIKCPTFGQNLREKVFRELKHSIY